jgi:hypothetical protein
MAKRAKPKYNCRQLELYAICQIALTSYRKNLSDFTNFKSFYNTAWGNTFEQAINTAKTLPGFQARDEKSETAKILLETHAKLCLAKWQDLKRYIATTTGWEKLQKPKLEAAGSKLYQKAKNNNWKTLHELMTTAAEFIQNNLTQLKADANMPHTYYAQFITLKNEYATLFETFTTAEQTNKIGTDKKITANNTIYTTLTKMFADAQAIFRSEPSTANRFKFTTLLKLIKRTNENTTHLPPS